MSKNKTTPNRSPASGDRPKTLTEDKGLPPISNTKPMPPVKPPADPPKKK